MAISGHTARVLENALSSADAAKELITAINAGGGAVSSVFTRTGAIVATTADYAVAQVTGAAPIAGPTFTGTVTAPIASIDSHYGVITADADASTIPFDLAASDKHMATLGGDRTLTVSNAHVGQQFVIILIQGSGGSHLATWFSGIKWPGGTVPTLTTAAGKADIFTFLCYAANSYYGFIAGQNL